MSLCPLDFIRLLIISAWVTSCTVAPAKLVRIPERRVALLGAKTVAVPHQHSQYADAIERDPDGPAGQRALAQLIREGRKQLAGTPGTREVRLSKDLILTFTKSARGIFAHDYFDELIPASSVRVTKLKNHRREGVGLPMIGVRENRGRDPIEAHFPPEAITRPITAVATVRHWRDGSRNVTITLYCPLCHQETLGSEGERPLAAEITAPWVALLERTGRLRATAVTGLLQSHPQRPAQLYLMEPYDPNREPLLMVHGLLSTPLGWATVTNELWADPEVRRRYQIWHYHYPTSAPFLYSASLFRQHIDEVRQLLRSQGYDEIRPMTIVAHSMGGLLTKTLITESGSKIWDTVMSVHPNQLRARETDLAMVRNILEWKASPHVRRVVFISVPHRGSKMSLSVIGRIGDALTRVPAELSDLCARLTRDNPEAIAPALRHTLARGNLTSIDTLSPTYPVLPVLNSLPVTRGVAVHSIIGNRGRPGSLDSGSDGVVPYTSSHWQDALSEKIVPAGHGAFRHPEALAEIVRILKLQPVIP